MQSSSGITSMNTNLDPHPCLSKSLRLFASMLPRWRATLWLSGGALSMVLLSGCASHKAMPASYLHQDREATIVIHSFPAKPTMSDSGEGGIIGALVTAT